MIDLWCCLLWRHNGCCDNWTVEVSEEFPLPVSIMHRVQQQWQKMKWIGHGQLFEREKSLTTKSDGEIEWAVEICKQ